MREHLRDQAKRGWDGELAYELQIVSEFYGMFGAEMHSMVRSLEIRPSNPRQL